MGLYVADNEKQPPEMFYKMTILENFATLLKRDSNTGVFLLILRNF